MLEEHLAAIAARDIDRFAATVSRAPDARVIGPDGGAIVGYAAIVAAHRDWFAPAVWTFAPRILLERVSDMLGFALLEVDYHETGVDRRFLLSVVFAREDGAWKLYFDPEHDAWVARPFCVSRSSTQTSGTLNAAPFVDEVTPCFAALQRRNVSIALADSLSHGIDPGEQLFG